MTSPTFLPRAGETGSDGVLNLRTLPSVDALLNLPELQEAIALHGRALVKRAIQSALAGLRKSLASAATAANAPERLQRFAHARWQRNARVQARALRNGQIFHASGPMRLGRDMGLRLMGGRLMDVPWLYGYRR